MIYFSIFLLVKYGVYNIPLQRPNRTLINVYRRQSEIELVRRRWAKLCQHHGVMSKSFLRDGMLWKICQSDGVLCKVFLLAWRGVEVALAQWRVVKVLSARRHTVWSRFSATTFCLSLVIATASCAKLCKHQGMLCEVVLQWRRIVEIVLIRRHVVQSFVSATACCNKCPFFFK